jgi:hypothetical protein
VWQTEYSVLAPARLPNDIGNRSTERFLLHWKWRFQRTVNWKITSSQIMPSFYSISETYSGWYTLAGLTSNNRIRKICVCMAIIKELVIGSPAAWLTIKA